MAIEEQAEPRPEEPAVRRGPGRPRDHARTRFILDAATEIVTEVGFERLRVQDVADRAGVSLATIYRRWPTKTALVVDAIRGDRAPLLLADSGDPATDMGELLVSMAAALANPRTSRMALMATQIDAPEVMRAVRETHVPPIRSHLRALLAQLLGPGHPDLDLLADLGPALIWYRRMVLGLDDDHDDLVARIVELAARS